LPAGIDRGIHVTRTPAADVPYPFATGPCAAVVRRARCRRVRSESGSCCPDQQLPSSYRAIDAFIRARAI